MALLRRILLLISSSAAIAAGVVTPAAPALASGGAPRGCSTGGTVTSGSSKVPCPHPISPANETTTPVKDLVLTWSSVQGASQYQVQIGRSKDWTSTVIDTTTIATRYEAPVSLPHTTYFWRVRAQVGGAWGAWSKVWRFLREWDQPEGALAVVQFPSSSDPTLAWAPVHDASEYYVIFSTTPVTKGELLNNVGGCFTNATSFTPGAGTVTEGGDIGGSCGGALTVGTAYYWGVAAFDDSSAEQVALQGGATGCGTKLPECDAATATGGPFTFITPPGGASTLTELRTSWHSNTPTANTCDSKKRPCPVTPTFSWTPVAGANIYDVSVYLDPAATTLYREYATQSPTFTPPDSYQDAQPGDPDEAAGKAYFWQVSAATCGGTGVLCTPPAAATQPCPAGTTTTTGTAPAVTGVSVSPAGPSGAQSMQGGTTATVTLTGTGVQNGACVVASAGVIVSVPTTATNSDGTSAVSFHYNAPVPGGNVTFQIENPNGALSAASSEIAVASSQSLKSLSSISSFKKRSGRVVLKSPADGATTHGRAVTFSWMDYLRSGSRGTLDPKNYELQVSRETTFTTNVLDLDNIDLTQYSDQTGALTDGHYFWRVAAIDESDNHLPWSATRELSVNASGPKASIATKNGVGTLHPITINFSEAVKGVNRRTVKIVPQGESEAHAVAGTVTLGASSRRYVFTPKHPLATGGVYDLWVSRSLKDANHNPVEVIGKSIRIKTEATNHNPGWTYSGSWARFRASSAYSGSYVSASSGHSASLTVAGSQAKVFACMGPGMGAIRISVAGHSQTVSEDQSFTRCGIEIWHRAIPSGLHTLTVSVASGVGNFDEVKVT